MGILEGGLNWVYNRRRIASTSTPPPPPSTPKKGGGRKEGTHFSSLGGERVIFPDQASLIREWASNRGDQNIYYTCFNSIINNNVACVYLAWWSLLCTLLKYYAWHQRKMGEVVCTYYHVLHYVSKSRDFWDACLLAFSFFLLLRHHQSGLMMAPLERQLNAPPTTSTGTYVLYTSITKTNLTE